MRAHSARRNKGRAARTQRTAAMHPELEGGEPILVGQVLEPPGARTDGVDEDVEIAPAAVEGGEGAVDVRCLRPRRPRAPRPRDSRAL